MTTICSQVPTLTQIATVPTAVQITTTSEVLSSFTTVTVTSIYTTTCDATNSCYSYLFATPEVTVTQTVTSIVSAIIISDGLATVPSTLFGSSCSTINGPVPPSTPTPGGITPGGITSPRVTPSLSGPSTASASSNTAAAAQATGSTPEKKIPLGPVIGGVVGGVILIAALAWLAWHFFHKPPVPKNVKHNSDHGKVERCEPQNWGENDVQQPLQSTGTEGQNATGNTGTEQNQNGYDYDYDRNRLPKRVEDKIKEKLDQCLNQPPTGGGVPPGLAGAVGVVDAGGPNSGYAPSPLSSPSPHSTVNVSSHQSQPSYSGGVGGTSPPVSGWNASSPPPGLYGVPLQGQTTYTQQIAYNPQFTPGQYRGYAEPAGTTDP